MAMLALLLALAVAGTTYLQEGIVLEISTASDETFVYTVPASNSSVFGGIRIIPCYGIITTYISNTTPPVVPTTYARKLDYNPTIAYYQDAFALGVPLTMYATVSPDLSVSKDGFSAVYYVVFSSNLEACKLARTRTCSHKLARTRTNSHELALTVNAVSNGIVLSNDLVTTTITLHGENSSIVDIVFEITPTDDPTDVYTIYRRLPSESSNSGDNFYTSCGIIDSLSVETSEQIVVSDPGNIGLEVIDQPYINGTLYAIVATRITGAQANYALVQISSASLFSFCLMLLAFF
jgi:hypothetical protein